jgi:hypothetical protein
VWYKSSGSGSGSCQLLDIPVVWFTGAPKAALVLLHIGVWGSAGADGYLLSYDAGRQGEYCLYLYGSRSSGGAPQSNSLAGLGLLWNGLAIMPTRSERSAGFYPVFVSRN